MQARIPFGMTNIARTLGTDALFSEWKINGEIDHFDEGWGMGAPISVVSGFVHKTAAVYCECNAAAVVTITTKIATPWEVG